MSTMTDFNPTPIGYMFFNETEARTVEAIAERVFPGDPLDPGAREASVVVYIDRAVAGYGKHLQRLYRRGVAELNRLTASRYNGKPFSQLSHSEQDGVLTELEKWGSPLVSGETDSQAAGETLLGGFFGAVRLHTLEGMFCDPMYGGNRNAVGWKLIGFPGAQWGYSAEQMKLGFDATAIPVKTLSDLRRERVLEPGTSKEAPKS